MNMGAWSYIVPRVNGVLSHLHSTRGAASSYYSGAAASDDSRMFSDVRGRQYHFKHSRNSGCWPEGAQLELEYRGRGPSARSATGSFKRHQQEMQQLFKEILAD